MTTLVSLACLVRGNQGMGVSRATKWIQPWEGERGRGGKKKMAGWLPVAPVFSVSPRLIGLDRFVHGAPVPASVPRVGGDHAGSMISNLHSWLGGAGSAGSDLRWNCFRNRCGVVCVSPSEYCDITARLALEGIFLPSVRRRRRRGRRGAPGET